MSTEPAPRPLTEPELLTLFVAMTRHERLIERAASSVQAHHFDVGGHENYLHAYFQAIVRCNGVRDAEGRIPFAVLRDELYVQAIVFDLPDATIQLLTDTPEDIEALDEEGHRPGLAWEACHSEDYAAIPVDFLYRQLERFLRERAARAMMRRYSTAASSIEALLEEVSEEQARIRRLRLPSDGFNPYSAGLDEEPPIRRYSTGVPLIDRLLGGNEGAEGWIGQADGEAYGLMGPNGGGKTTLAVQLAVATAREYRRQALAEDRDPRVVVYFSNEDSRRRLLSRVYGFAAWIDRERAMQLSSAEFNRKPRPLLPYEERLYDQHAAERRLLGEPPLSREEFDREYERYLACRAEVEQNLIAVDVRVDPVSALASAGVPGLIDFLEQYVLGQGRRLGAVFLDSLDRFVNALDSVQAARDSRSQILLELVRQPDALRTAIATRYQCPVWMTNQTAAAENDRPAHHPPTKSQATGAKGWSNALDYVITMARPDKRHKVSAFLVDKSRSTGSEGTKVLARLDGNFARWVDAEEQFQFDDVTGEIQPIADLAEAGMARRPRTRVVRPRGRAADVD